MKKNGKMRAAIWTAYGPPEVLQIQEVHKPEPASDQILIKIQASTVFAGDAELRRFDVLPSFRLPLRLGIGIRRPKRVKTLGQEFAGVVESVGSKVTRFKPGDKVFGPSPIGFSCNAEYICIKESTAITSIPAGAGFSEAAALCGGGLNALYFHRMRNIQAGQKVLLIGAGGSIGTISLQLAKLAGAEVTIVDSASKLELLKELGADHVVDYQNEDLASIGERYDLVFNIHAKSKLSTGLKLLNKQGLLLIMNAYFLQIIAGLFVNLFNSKSVKLGVTKYRSDDLDYLAELVAAGKLKVVIDREYKLDDVVAAHHYADSGEKTGNLVLTN